VPKPIACRSLPGIGTILFESERLDIRLVRCTSSHFVRRVSGMFLDERQERACESRNKGDEEKL
jgi:hypothetical protein